ncbi:MAG TPA: hypothetical protein VK524_28330 [Polyangiaceae bacterium]|nr:hypothetical protein [Polyangiaceae bacterium]
MIGDLTNIAKDVFVLIERDSKFGPAAEIKRLYLIDLNVTGDDGVLEKRLLIDLLDIDDPRDLGGNLPGLEPKKFNMPFDSIESVSRSTSARSESPSTRTSPAKTAVPPGCRTIPSPSSCAFSDRSRTTRRGLAGTEETKRRAARQTLSLELNLALDDSNR